MRSKLPSLTQAAALTAALVLICGSCVLFHQHSSYRHIHQYVKDGDVANVELELSKNPGDLNLPDDAGLTPLHLAALHCQTKVRTLLLDKAAKVNSKANDDSTPLHLAAQEGCANAVTLLLAKGRNGERA